jgi:hypothetical protein
VADIGLGVVGSGDHGFGFRLSSILREMDGCEPVSKRLTLQRADSKLAHTALGGGPAASVSVGD